jgi:mRNA degradation ribonuclease J1/J2
VDDEMFMLDAGLMFPEDEMLGVDIVIPDIQYVMHVRVHALERSLLIFLYFLLRIEYLE